MVCQIFMNSYCLESGSAQLQVTSWLWYHIKFHFDCIVIPSYPLCISNMEVWQVYSEVNSIAYLRTWSAVSTLMYIIQETHSQLCSTLKTSSQVINESACVSTAPLTHTCLCVIIATNSIQSSNICKMIQRTYVCEPKSWTDRHITHCVINSIDSPLV